jgi:DNA-binding CsgD family transcriptional regulator/PAS domain-containing protein
MMRWDVGTIEQAFAEAALEPTRWNAAMDVAYRIIGGSGAAIFPIQGRLPLVPHSESMAEGFEIYVRDGWIHRDERYRGASAMMRKGITTEFDFITPEEMKRNPYYQEFLAPLGFKWFAGVLLSAGPDRWSLSFQRTEAEGPFSQEEQEQLATLSRRLSAAPALARALGFSAGSAALEAFEISGTAVALLDRAGEVIRLNRQAEALLGHGIRVEKKRVIAETRDATDALDRALRALLWHSLNKRFLAPVLLPRPGRRPLIAHAVGLASIASNPFAECRALLVFNDPEFTRPPPEHQLCILFGLTKAQAKLCTYLARGETLEAAAEALGIAKSTARNQLKAIFDKTDVHRQAELVRLFASLTGP